MNAVDLFVSRYPNLYHVAFAGSVEAIRKHGLLSTSALLAEAGVAHSRCEELTTQRRPEAVSIQSPLIGEIWIRDQIPLNEVKLAKCLEGCTVAEYLRFLNAHVFLWPTIERAETMLNAAAYAGTPHVLFHLDTQSLLERYEQTILLSPINSGATLYHARPRGFDTFQSLADFPLKERLAQQGRKGAVAEMLVPGGIRDIREYMVATEVR